MNDQVCVIITTFDNKEEALKLSKQLLEQKLIGCAQISEAVTSVYKWQGRVKKLRSFG